MNDLNFDFGFICLGLIFLPDQEENVCIVQGERGSFALPQWTSWELDRQAGTPLGSVDPRTVLWMWNAKYLPHWDFSRFESHTFFHKNISDDSEECVIFYFACVPHFYFRSLRLGKM